MATSLSYDITTQRSKVVRSGELSLSFCHKPQSEKDLILVSLKLVIIETCG